MILYIKQSDPIFYRFHKVLKFPIALFVYQKKTFFHKIQDIQHDFNQDQMCTLKIRSQICAHLTKTSFYLLIIFCKYGNTNLIQFSFVKPDPVINLAQSYKFSFHKESKLQNSQSRRVQLRNQSNFLFVYQYQWLYQKYDAIFIEFVLVHMNKIPLKEYQQPQFLHVSSNLMPFIIIIIMKYRFTISSVLIAYRECLKQLQILKYSQPLLSQHFKSSLIKLKSPIYREQNKNYHQLRSIEQVTIFLNGFQNLLIKVNMGHKKSLLKFMRIFLNQSKFISNDLLFSPNYVPKSLQKLQQDNQFIKLQQKDKKFVKDIINRICNRKINSVQFRFKTVAQYLYSNTSQSAEQQISIDQSQLIIYQQYGKYFSKRNNIFAKIFHQLVLKKDKKIQNAIEQIQEYNILLL